VNQTLIHSLGFINGVRLAQFEKRRYQSKIIFFSGNLMFSFLEPENVDLEKCEQ